jgi:hypothetical protein
MKLTKRWNPAHIEYSITMVRPNGSKDTYYNGACYRARDMAQKVADKINASRDHAKYGVARVDERKIKGAYVYQGYLTL